MRMTQTRSEPRAWRTALQGSSLVLALALVGCGLKGEDLPAEGENIVNDANEADQTVGIAAAIAALPALALNESQVTLNAAVAAQATLPKFALPAGCLTVATQGNVVTYTMSQCTGPWGQVKVSGDETATFTGDEDGKFSIDLEGPNLTVNGSPAAHQAKITLAFKNGTRTVDWTGTFRGKTLGGRPVSQTADLKIVSSAGTCFTANGTASSTIGLRGLSAQYQDFQRCGPLKTCPSGTIVGTGQASRFKVTLTFDGTTEGVATARNGGEKVFELDCEPTHK